MKNIALQIGAALPGVVMLLNGIGFVVDPARAADGLGMPLLDGIARSTQVGDMAAFFFAAATFIFLGAMGRAWRWLCAGALLLGFAALFRTLTFLFHDAPFATQFIVPEIIMTIWLLGFAAWFRRHSG